jgi:predicted RNase H-like HicB family nuclease
VASASAALISSSYSTSVGGKSYSGSITQSNGTYTVSVPNLPGASVSGSSLQAAENALTVRIDTLV